MAQYSALWTSARDPEYLQIKKVKQLTERRLAMDISRMEEVYRRHVRKTQEQIRENQDILETLEREKETRARHVLATYHRHQRMKAAANRFIRNFRIMKETRVATADKQQEPNTPQVTKNKTTPSTIAMTTQQQDGQRPLAGKEKLPGIKHRILMVHTFPYVYHSHGVKPCPRYDMFHESQEYGPPEVTSKGPPSKPRGPSLTGAATKRNSLFPAPPLTTSVPSLPAIREHPTPLSAKSKVQHFLTAFRAVGALSKR